MWTPSQRLEEDTRDRSSGPARLRGIAGAVFIPTEPPYNAVGDGVRDDSAALQACLDAARASVGSTFHLPVVDLAGRTYAVGTQLEVPGGHGLIIRNGRLVATPTFDTTKYLLATGRTSDATLADGFRIHNLTVRDVYFDNQHRGGGLLIQRHNRVRVESCTFHGYSTHGLRTAVDGHEVMVSTCQFAEYFWNESLAGGNAQDHADLYTGTGIRLETHDNHITDVVVQLSKVGIYLANSKANVIRGAHIWPGYVRTAGTSGASSTLDLINEALHIDAASLLNNITHCYFDGGTVVWENPWKASLTNCVFLNGAGDPNKGMLVFKAIGPGIYIDGVTITGNSFSVLGGGTMQGLLVDTSAGTFSGGNIRNCRWTDNAFSGVTSFYSRYRGQLSQSGEHTWTIDLSAYFPLGGINQFIYSVYYWGAGQQLFRLTSISGNVATVQAFSAASPGVLSPNNATVHFEADICGNDI